MGWFDDEGWWDGQKETWGQAFVKVIIVFAIGFGILWLINIFSDAIAVFLGQVWLIGLVLAPFILIYLAFKAGNK